LAEARKLEDADLVNVIELGRWTGARIEELCALKTERVHKDYFQVADAKTDAGWRDIPIHFKLAPHHGATRGRRARMAMCCQDFGPTNTAIGPARPRSGSPD
jgi:hypothetical protein